jgi:hypothetical protein
MNENGDKTNKKSLWWRHLAFVLPKPMKDIWENRKHLQAILKER